MEKLYEHHVEKNLASAKERGSDREKEMGW